MTARINYRRDFEFPGLIEHVDDRGEYLAFRTPSLPRFYWGNYLLFPNPPDAGDYDRWRAAYHAEFGHVEGLRHEAYGWDTPSGEGGHVEPFVEAGFRVSRGSVMVAEQVTQPPHLNPDVVVRAADSETEWEAAIDCISEYSAGGVTVNRRLARKLQIWRGLTEGGTGGWHNAYLEGRCVGGLGTYRIQDVIVVEDVGTREEFRGRGVARTAVCTACREAIGQKGVERLLLQADHMSAAERMYGQIGFRPVAQLLGLLKTT